MDLRIWKPCPSGVFSIKSFARCVGVEPDFMPSSSLVWLGLAPPRMEAFCWLVISKKKKKGVCGGSPRGGRHFD